MRAPLSSRRRLPAAPKLTDQVAEALQRHILDGGLTPGDQLPTITDMSATYGVSPTVVREALARLRSDGLVETRQGSGAYVAGTARPFRIAPGLTGDALVRRVLELRLGVETEAAALAARRARRPAVKRLEDAFDALARRIGAGEPATAEDLRFHRCIADAADNPLFGEFLSFLQQYLTDSIALSHGFSRRRDRMATVLAEHARIRDAIAAGDADAARDAMRAHLEAGIARIARGDDAPG
ncbi:MAG TPA: FCD domain-containing protein [Roseomonas sp.]